MNYFFPLLSRAPSELITANMMKSEPRGGNRGFGFGGFTFFPHLVEPFQFDHCRHDEEPAAWGIIEGSYGGCHIGQLVLEFIL